MEHKSPANQYELVLLEDKGSLDVTLPAEGRMVKVFGVLDETISHLGVYTRLYKLIRQELYNAVYSGQYSSDNQTDETNTDESGVEKTAPSLQKIPYFRLCTDIQHKRNEEADNIQQELEKVQENLDTKKQEFDELSESYDESLKTIEARNESIQQLEDNVALLKSEIQKLNLQYRQLEKLKSFNEEVHEDEIKALKLSLGKTETNVKFLSDYKKRYDVLDIAFRPPEISAPKKSMKVKLKQHSQSMASATKKNNLLSDLNAAKVLDRQMLEVQNATIEEFDQYIESHKQKLGYMKLTDNINDHDYEKQESIIQNLDVDLSETQQRFHTTIEDINSELTLLRAHVGTLDQELVRIESENTTAQEQTQKTTAVGEVESVEMESYIPEENVLSRYAAIIYMSNNNKKTFHALPENQYCLSCGEKTLICPHKIGADNRIIALPRKCTHLKIARPKIQITVTPVKKVDTEKPKSADKVVSHRRKKRQRQTTTTTAESEGTEGTDEGESSRPSSSLDTDRSSTKTTHTSSDSSVNTADVISNKSETTEERPQTARPSSGLKPVLDTLETAFQVLWTDYKTRTENFQRSIPRSLSMERIMSMIEQFMAVMIWQDEMSTGNDQNLSFIDAFYDFLADRFIIEEITHSAAYDILVALQVHAHRNMLVLLFVLQLAGDLDGCCYRYILQMADIVQNIEWRQVDDFKAFSAVIYPFLSDEDVEQLMLDFISYCENRISSSLVMDFILYSVLKKKEPRIQDAEMKLIQMPSKDFGLMTSEEYTHAVEHLVPMISARTRQRLFEESIKHQYGNKETDRIALDRLYCLVGFLMLVDNLPSINLTINKSIIEQRPISNAEKEKNNMTVVQHEVPSEGRMTRYSELRNMANNFARRIRNRSMRRLQNNLGMTKKPKVSSASDD